MADQQKLFSDVGALKSQLKILTGTLRAPRDAERFTKWLVDYGLANGWGVPAADIITFCGPNTTWQGAPSNVSLDKLIPVSAIGRFDNQVIYQICSAQRYTAKMTGVGFAKHFTWAGGTQCVAALIDEAVADQPAFSALNSDLMGLGALLVGLISTRATGLPLGKTREHLVESRTKLTANCVLRCADPGLIDAATRQRLSEALTPFRGHMRFQHGVLLAWDWLGKDEHHWDKEVASALQALDHVHAALFPTAAAGGRKVTKTAKAVQKSTRAKKGNQLTQTVKASPPTKHTERQAGSHASHNARARADRPAGKPATLQMRLVDLSGTRRRNPTTGASELQQGKSVLRLPSGVAGTLVRHLVEPGQELAEGTPIALLELDSRSSVRCVTPRCEGWRVVRRSGVGKTITSRTNIVHLQRAT